MTEDLELEIDVPDLIGALAEVLHDHGIPTSTAIRMAAEMLQEAMDQPDSFYEFATLH
jgi:5-carboxymethyl-2-hydroxymuconate isomerase